MSRTVLAPVQEVGSTRDVRELADRFRCHTPQWLDRHIAALERWIRQAQAEHAVACSVRDERGGPDATPDASVSARTARTTLEVGRALEALPEVASAALAGEVSMDQLEPLVQVATPESDAEWAQRGPRMAPADLQQLARRARVVTAAEAEARREARELRMWREPQAGMLAGRFRLPDVDGALVESVFQRMCDRQRPAKGQPWAPLRHRMADALVDLCRNYAEVDPTGRSRPHVIIQKPANGPAEVNGIPIADATFAPLVRDARVEEQLVDERGGLVTDSNLDQDSIPADVRRFVLTRDRHCRTPGCERPADHIHHMDPRCAGGNHDPNKLAGVCRSCHPRYEPHGPYRLVGDPDQIDGLRLVRIDGLPDARAGPDASAA